MIFYEIAFSLGVPVYVVKSLPYDEFQGWLSYFEKRPYGWREDDRVFKLLQAQGIKKFAWQLFPSLAAIYKPNKSVIEEDGKMSVDALKGSSIFQKMMNATGGEKLKI